MRKMNKRSFSENTHPHSIFNHSTIPSGSNGHRPCAVRTCSPSSSSTRRNTPWAAGCCGPKFIVYDATSRPPVYSAWARFAVKGANDGQIRSVTRRLSNRLNPFDFRPLTFRGNLRGDLGVEGSLCVVLEDLGDVQQLVTRERAGVVPHAADACRRAPHGIRISSPSRARGGQRTPQGGDGAAHRTQHVG